MNSLQDFYDKMDLKYPEIAIAMDDIDRMNPGRVRFIIPILTPHMDKDKITNKTIYQNRSSLRNDKSVKLEIGDVGISNFIHINVPAEVCNVYHLTNENRYIQAGSKWIVIFVGGDITKPRIISRYLD